MGQVIYLHEVRAGQFSRKINSAPDTASEAYYRIDAYAAKHKLASGAVRLLYALARANQQGEVSLSYNDLSRRLGGSRRTVIRHLGLLEDKGLVKIRRARLGKTAVTNQIEIDFTSPLGDAMPPIPPTNTKNWGSDKKAKQRIGVVSEWHCRDKDKEIKNNNNSLKGIRREAPRFDSVEDAIKSAAKKTGEARARKILKAGNQLTMAGVKATWSTVMLRHFPTVPPVVFTVKEFAIFKKKIEPILGVCGLSEFFEFIVEGWGSLRETKFIWLRVKGKDIALAPSLPELMRYWKIFAQAFSDTRMQEASGVHNARRTAMEDAQDALAEARGGQARLAAENAKLRERLAKAERLAYAPTQARATARAVSLTEGRKAAVAAYNEELDLPDWK